MINDDPGRKIRRRATAKATTMVTANCRTSGAMFARIRMQTEQTDTRVFDAFLWV